MLNKSQPIFINNEKSENDNNKNKNKRKKANNKKKNEELKKALVESNNTNPIIIFKKVLPNGLVNEIEFRNKMLIPKIHYYNNNSINNNINLSHDSVYKTSQVNDSNICEEYSFSSELKYDFYNKNIISEIHNSPKEKNLIVNNENTINSINSIKNSNDINRSKGGFFDYYLTEKSNDEKMENIPNLPFKNNNFLKKDFPDYQRKNQLELKSEISSRNNNSFRLTDHDNNFNFYNKDYLNEVTEITDISSNRYKYNCDINTKNNFAPHEIDNDDIIIMKKIKKKNKSKSYEKFINKNVEVLYTLEFNYKKNKEKEIIVKKCTEVPYNIIINKSAINIEEVKSFLTENSIISSREKSFSFASVINNDNNNEKNNLCFWGISKFKLMMK